MLYKLFICISYYSSSVATRTRECATRTCKCNVLLNVYSNNTTIELKYTCIHIVYSVGP